MSPFPLFYIQASTITVSYYAPQSVTLLFRLISVYSLHGTMCAAGFCFCLFILSLCILQAAVFHIKSTVFFSIHKL